MQPGCLVSYTPLLVHWPQLGRGNADGSKEGIFAVALQVAVERLNPHRHGHRQSTDCHRLKICLGEVRAERAARSCGPSSQQNSYVPVLAVTSDAVDIALAGLLAMWATAYTVLYYAAACPARYAAQSVTKVCSFVFYNIFLLRIPSFACFRYPIEELLEELPFVNARNRKAWSIFIDTLKSDWAKSDGDCLIMLSCVYLRP